MAAFEQDLAWMYEKLQDLWDRTGSVDDVFEEVSGYMNGMREAQPHPVSLPKIDDAVLEEFHDTPLIEYYFSNPQQNRSMAPRWSQLAVDFACLLNGASTKPLGGE